MSCKSERLEKNRRQYSKWGFWLGCASSSMNIYPVEDLEVLGFTYQQFSCFFSVIIALFFPSNDCKHCPYMRTQMFIYAEHFRKIIFHRWGKLEKFKYLLGFSMKFVAELQGESDFFQSSALHNISWQNFWHTEWEMLSYDSMEISKEQIVSITII